MSSPGSYELVTAPASEPVTVAEAKAHARIEHAADDAIIGYYITGARELVEKLTNRALITQTWKLTLDNWPGAARDNWWSGVREGPISMLEGDEIEIELRKAPFIDITHVKTMDESDALTTWASSNYYKVKRRGFGRLVKKQAVVWPDISTRSVGAIVITFTAGYGASASDVPMALRQAIKDIVAHWHANREAALGDNLSQVPLKTAMIIQQHVVPR